MSIEYEIDGPSFPRKPGTRSRRAVGPRFVVYLHLFVLIPTVLYGQCERWGYGAALQAGLRGQFFQAAGQMLAFSIFAFPPVVWLLWRNESPRERWSWVALPLTVALSFVQFLALLPLVQ